MAGILDSLIPPDQCLSFMGLNRQSCDSSTHDRSADPQASLNRSSHSFYQTAKLSDPLVVALGFSRAHSEMPICNLLSHAIISFVHRTYETASSLTIGLKSLDISHAIRVDASRATTASVAAQLEPEAGQFRLNKLAARCRIGSRDDYRSGIPIVIFDWKCHLNKNIPFSFQIATAAKLEHDWYAPIATLSCNYALRLTRARHVAGTCGIVLHKSRGYRLWESSLPQIQGLSVDPAIKLGFWKAIGRSNAVIRASTKLHLLQRRAIIRVGGILTMPDLPSPFAQLEYDTSRRSSFLAVGIKFG